MDRAEEALRQVRVPSPERRIKDYPHQLSGGMRQRVMIAIALACGPDLLIADEPTTALDVTVQAEIIDLMAELCAAKGTAILMISHDLGLVANMCRRVAVMYAGRIVESQVAEAIFATPRHPYTKGLVDSLPPAGRAFPAWPPAPARDLRRRAVDRDLPAGLPLQSALPGGDGHLPDSTAPEITTSAGRRPGAVPPPWLSSCSKLDDLAVHFTVGGALKGGVKTLKAVDGVSLDVKPGECLGLVGEIGLRQVHPGAGHHGPDPADARPHRLNGHELSGRERMETARTVQMVFQDPYASLNPRQTVRRTLADPLRLHGVTDKAEVEQRVMDMMAKVGLRPDHADRYPHEFSGGQRQRIGIARALILKPKLVICDEPVSALDVSIRAQIINLLLDLKDEMGLAYIMISHDLGVVEHVSDRVGGDVSRPHRRAGRLAGDLRGPAPSLYARADRGDPRPVPSRCRRRPKPRPRARSPARSTRRRAATSIRAAR